MLLEYLISVFAESFPIYRNKIDVVIVRVQSTVEHGEDAVVMVDGCEATVKKVQYLSNGILLQPFNPSFEPIFYSKEEAENLPVRIFGKVVECRQKY